MRIDTVNPVNLPKIWHEIKPLIDKAFKHNQGERTANDMLEQLMHDELHLLISTDDKYELTGVIVAEELIHPLKKELFVWTWATANGNADEFCYEAFENALIGIAESTGCHYISTWCRKGLAKKMTTLRGWEDSYSVITKHLH
jgi:hypothetical protein